MTVTSDLVSHGPVRPIGANVTLTCTVELSPAVDVPVTVNTVWTGPTRLMSNNTAQPVMGSATMATYTSTAIVRSFERDQSGNYTCTATVSSVSPFITTSSLSGVTSVTTGNIRFTAYLIHIIIIIIIIIIKIIIIIIIIIVTVTVYYFV